MMLTTERMSRIMIEIVDGKKPKAKNAEEADFIKEVTADIKADLAAGLEVRIPPGQEVEELKMPEEPEKFEQPPLLDGWDEKVLDEIWDNLETDDDEED